MSRLFFVSHILSYRIIARFSKLKILRRRSLITYERITFRDWTIDAPFRVRIEDREST